MAVSAHRMLASFVCPYETYGLSHIYNLFFEMRCIAKQLLRATSYNMIGCMGMANRYHIRILLFQGFANDRIVVADQEASGLRLENDAFLRHESLRTRFTTTITTITQFPTTGKKAKPHLQTFRKYLMRHHDLLPELRRSPFQHCCLFPTVSDYCKRPVL